MSEFDKISGFADNEPTDNGYIDFASATRLERTGSTCDAFVTKLHRRRVFIKRLKDQFRDSSRHRAALDKEYDLGVNLHHPSLPDYREFHGDYIVMDFVDGLTIAEMIRRNDPWLSNPDNVSRMLTQLIDVVDYLHQHNVLHCDIKSDNVMLTSGQRNLMLIDLDKAYTDWLDDTAGDPSLYDSTTHQSDMDFHGIGKLVERLDENLPGFPGKNFRRFKKLCYKPGVTPDELRKVLPSSGKGWLRPIIISCLILMVAATAFFLFRSGHPEISSDASPLLHNDTTEIDTTTTHTQDTTPSTKIDTTTSKSQQSQSIVRPIELPELFSEIKTQLPSDPEARRQKIAENRKAELNGPNKKYYEVIDRESAKYIKGLKLEIQQMLNSINDTTLSFSEMFDRLHAFAEKESETRAIALAHLCTLFPESDKFHVSLLMIQSESWCSYQQFSDTTLRKYSDAALLRK